MSNNLWNRVANFFKEWDGEDMTKSMPLYVDELRQINSDRIDLIRLERERKEIRNKAIEEFVKEALKQFTEFDLKHGYPTVADCEMILKDVSEQMKEVRE